MDKEALTRWRRRIRDVLNTDWDPIGGCPEDEYDRYVEEIGVMLRNSVSDEELGAYLRRAETEYMGLSQQPDRKQRIATAIGRLRAITFADEGGA